MLGSTSLPSLAFMDLPPAAPRGGFHPLVDDCQ